LDGWWSHIRANCVMLDESKYLRTSPIFVC
jgi:hypothetical protein